MTNASSDDILSFCRLFPKVELHAHLNGCIRDDTLRELYQTLYHESVVLPPRRTLDECFQTFNIIYKVVLNVEIVRRIVREMISDFAADGVCYLEIRTTLKALGGTTRRDYLDAVVSEIERAMETPGSTILVKLLVSINRQGNLAEALEAVELGAAFRSRGVVGVDFCGNPKVGPFVDFLPAIERAKALGLPLTIHFAEIANEEESWAILRVRPDRLGHACFLTPALEEELQRLGIPVELCLTSNVMGEHKASYESHHVRDFWRWRHPFAVCTDDTTLFQIESSHEHWRAALACGWTREDLFAVSRQALRMAFASEVEKARLERELLEFQTRLLVVK